MLDRRSANLVLSCCLIAACGASRAPTEKTHAVDAVPVAGQRFHYAMSVKRRGDIPPQAAKDRPAAFLRAMNSTYAGDVDVMLAAVTDTGYDVHWQAALTEHDPNTPPGTMEDTIRRMHLFELNLPIDASIDLTHVRPEITIRNAAQLRVAKFAEARELLGARASELGCDDESTQTRCPLVRGTEARLASTLSSQIATMFGCSTHRMADPALTHWREVRRAADIDLELAVRLDFSDRVIDPRRKTMRLHYDIAPEPESLRAAADGEAREIVRETMRYTRYSADCDVSTVSAMPYTLEFSERFEKPDDGTKIGSVVRFERR